MVLKEVIYWIIPLVVLIIVATIFLLGDESLFGKTSETTLKLKEMLPNVTVGGEIKGEKPTIAESGAETALNSLKETIQQMLDSQVPNCFANYGTLPALAEKGTSIYFNYGSGQTKMTVKGGAGGKQLVTVYDLPGMIPCVIGGQSGDADISENFYSTYLNPDPSSVQGSAYSPLTDLVISRDDGGFTGFTENRINYGQGPTDFEDGGWLFTPDHKHICFFPTVDGDNDADGLNDDYLIDGTNSESIPYRVNNGQLKKC